MRKRSGGSSGSSAIPFSSEDFKYRPDEFLTSGHDDKGQSTRLTFRCPPMLDRALEVIRDSKVFPYATVTDIIRHAVIRHVEWLHRLEPDMPRHFISGLNAINEICRDQEMMANMQQTYARMDALIESHLAAGDLLEVQRLLSVCKGQITRLPESRWKKDFLTKFAAKYARHLPGAVSSGTSPNIAGRTVVAFPGGDSGSTTSEPEASGESFDENDFDDSVLDGLPSGEYGSDE